MQFLPNTITEKTVKRSIIFAVIPALILTSYIVDKRVRAIKFRFLQVSMRSSVYAVAQAFYDIGNGINDADSSKLPINKGKEFSTYRFPLSNAAIHDIRLTLPNQSGQVSLKEIMLVNELEQVVQKIHLRALQPLHQTYRLNIENDILTIENEGPANDPVTIRFALEYPIESGIDISTSILAFGLFCGTFGLSWGIILLCLHFIVQSNPAKIIRLVKHICFSCLLITFCLLVLEFLMIVLEPYLFKGFYQYDPEFGFRVRPYANGSNRFGFNDRDDYPIHKPKENFRILVVGDSFGWVGKLDRNYTALLENKFEEYYGEHRVDVINTGYPTTHSGEQLLMLKRYGLQYNPDLVFLGFFCGNDFVEAHPYRKRIIVNTTFFDIDRRYERTLFGYPIVKKSRLWYFIKQRYRILQEKIRVHFEDAPPASGSEEEKVFRFSEETFFNIERLRLDFCNIKAHQQGVYNMHINFVFKNISRMKELLEARHCQFVVGMFPDEFQINDDLVRQIFEYFDLEEQDYDLQFMQRLLKFRLDAENIPYVDLLRDFRREGRHTQLYFPQNTHWNDAGNELATQIIFQYLLPTVDSWFKSNYSETTAD